MSIREQFGEFVGQMLVNLFFGICMVLLITAISAALVWLTHDFPPMFMDWLHPERVEERNRLKAEREERWAERRRQWQAAQGSIREEQETQREQVEAAERAEKQRQEQLRRDEEERRLNELLNEIEDEVRSQSIGMPEDVIQEQIAWLKERRGL